MTLWHTSRPTDSAPTPHVNSNANWNFIWDKKGQHGKITSLAELLKADGWEGDGVMAGKVHERVTTILATHLQPGDRVADVFCGSGPVMFMMLEKLSQDPRFSGNGRVLFTGMDYARELLKLGSK